MSRLLSNNPHLKGDISGGLIAGIIAIPLALSFGLQSGLGPAAGLYSAIILGLMVTLFGGTPIQISGPTGPMTVMSALVVAGALNFYGTIANGLGLIITTFFLAGCFQIALGFARVGHYIRYIPMPVISGFMSGIGAIIILYQLPLLLGSSVSGSTVAILQALPGMVLSVNPATLMLGGLTLALLWLTKRWNHIIPSAITALIAGTLIGDVLALEVAHIGDVPRGFGTLQVDKLFQFNSEHIIFAVTSAMGIAGLGVVDSLLTCVIVDRLLHTQSNVNKECVGQGLGNAMAALLGAIPGSGATMRTMANLNAGGRTRISGITHAGFLILVLLGLGPYVSAIPQVVLAAILIDVGINIIDKKSLRLIPFLPRTDIIIMASAALLTVFTNLLLAIGAGMILTAFFLIKELYELSAEESKTATFTTMTQAEKTTDALHVHADFCQDNIYVKSIHGPLFWGISEKFRHLIARETVRELLIYMGNLHRLDQTGLYAFEEALSLLKTQGITVYLVHCQAQPLQLLQQTRFIPDAVAAERVFATYSDFISYRQNTVDNATKKH